MSTFAARKPFGPPVASVLGPLLVGALALGLAGCDDSTDGTGGSSSSTGTSMGTTSSSSSSSSSTGSGVTPSEWDAYCDARGALACMGFDVAACKMQQACATALLRDEIEKDLLKCLQQGCVTDNCLAVGATKPLSSVGMEFQTACQNYVTNCPGVSDDVCSDPYLLTDATLMDGLTCFSAGNCPMKESCITAFGDQLNTCQSWL